MTDALMTVVRCQQCERSASLSLHEGRFWCAHCQTWAHLTVEQRAMAGHASDAQRRSGTAAVPVRQPLRVPSGWQITYHGWYEGELGNPEMDQDLLIASHARQDRVLDVSWYYGESDSACYRLTVWARSTPEEMLHDARHDEHSSAVAHAEYLLATITAGRL